MKMNDILVFWACCSYTGCSAEQALNAEWHALLDQLEIPDGVVSGLSASDKPVPRGKLLQLPVADMSFFFVGQPLVCPSACVSVQKAV